MVRSQDALTHSSGTHRRFKVLGFLLNQMVSKDILFMAIVHATESNIESEKLCSNAMHLCALHSIYLLVCLFNIYAIRPSNVHPIYIQGIVQKAKNSRKGFGSDVT
jgi:hypothetical protein